MAENNGKFKGNFHGFRTHHFEVKHTILIEKFFEVVYNSQLTLNE